jgi:uncharacterized protein YjbI with pentapeptide repeats
VFVLKGKFPMSELEQTQVSANGRIVHKTKQSYIHASTLEHPANDDKEGWKAHREAQGQPWRTEPTISTERQTYLARLRTIMPDVEEGIYPFKGIKLSRADVEWLLSTHEDGSNTADRSAGIRREHEGLDLRGADLQRVNLRELPLKGSYLSKTHLEGADLSFANLDGAELSSTHLDNADLYGAHLEGTFLNLACLENANLNSAHLQYANLNSANLQGANLSFVDLKESSLWRAQLQGANLHSAHLEGANLRSAQLQGAGLNNAYFDNATKLNGAFLEDKTWGVVSLADIFWNNVNITVVDWSLISELGDEQHAREEEERGFERDPRIGYYPEDRHRTLDEYRKTVRAYRQLSVVLRSQGLNEDAARFAYRAQLMQKKVYRFSGKIWQYLGSLFLDLLSGYGYRVVRCFIAYALVITIFATIYHQLGANLAWNEAIVISMTAFHGRGFFPDQFKPGDPQAMVAAIEAFVGLLIEVTFIATLTQRLFGK